MAADALSPYVARTSAAMIYINYIEYVGPYLTCGRISSTCVISVWRNDTKCKYMFMFALKNLARKGLMSHILSRKMIMVLPNKTAMILDVQQTSPAKFPSNRHLSVRQSRKYFVSPYLGNMWASLCFYSRCCTDFHYNDVIMSAMASQTTGRVSIVCSTVCSGEDQRKH